MFRAFNSLIKGAAFALAALLTVSPASAQPSGLGHAAAPGYRPNSSTLRVYPGDKGYHSTMQIQRYYQMRKRARSSASPSSVSPTRYTAVPAAPVTPNVVVSIGEPASKPALVDIRGPDGKIRSFAVAAGNDVIKPRTIVLHPGDSLTIRFAAARAQAPKKP